MTSCERERANQSNLLPLLRDIEQNDSLDIVMLDISSSLCYNIKR